MTSQGIQRKARCSSRLTGYEPEAPPRIGGKELDQMHKAANDFLAKSEQRMAAKVKFTKRG